MKKFGIAISVFFAVIIAFWIIARLTGVLQWYVVPTSSSVPNLKVGQHFFSSILKQPQRLDFIVYLRKSPSDGQTEIYTHRLCAIEGDIVEIKDGILLVNGKRIDNALNLEQEYLISSAELQRIKTIAKLDENNVAHEENGMAWIFMDEQFMAKHHVNAKKIVRPRTEKDEYIQNIWKADWNADQFGPLVVPKDSYFVLGDNRHNSLDSRYVGFIPKENWRGTMLQ